MKTLSVKQPWAYLICCGIKDIENRTWKTNYRGKILIHACKEWDERSRDMSSLFTPAQFGSLNEFMRNIMVMQPIKLLNISAIIGSVEIVDCIKDSISIWSEDFCCHWVLRNPVLFEKPILNVKGKLNLWEYDYEN